MTAAFAIPALVVLLFAAGLAAWARWLAGRPNTPKWMRPASWIFFACPLVPWLLVGMILRAGEQRAAGLVAEERAKVLAQATAEALNASVLSIPLLLISAIILAVQTIRATDTGK